MSDRESKELRYKVVADEPAIRNAKRLTTDLEQALRSLGMTAERVSKQMSSIGGGPQATGPRGNVTGPASVSSSSAGVGAGIGRMLDEQKRLFQTIQTGSTSALKATTDSLRTESQKQREYVRSMTSDLKELAKAQGAAYSAGPNRVANAGGRQYGPMFGDLRTPTLWQPTVGGPPGGGAPPGAAAGGMGAAAGGLAGMWKSAAPYLGVGMALRAGRSFIDETEGQIWDPFRRMGMQTSAQHTALQMARGDFRPLLAARHIGQDPELKKRFDLLGGVGGPKPGSSTSANWFDGALRSGAGAVRGAAGWADSKLGTGGALGKVAGYAMSVPKAIYNDAAGWIYRRATNQVDPGGDDKWREAKAVSSVIGRGTLLDPAGAAFSARRQFGDIPSKQVEDQIKAIQGVQHSNPLATASADWFMGNWQNTLSMQKALNMGSSKLRPDGTRTNYGLNAGQRLQHRALYEEGVQALHGIAGIGGMGTGHAYYGSAASALSGGMTGVSQIIGQAAHAGTANGGRFFSGVQDLVGRRSGGIDVSAANQIGLMASGALLNGSGMSSGLGLLGMLGANARGATAGDDMRIANQLQGGLGAMNNMFGGKIDPYQQGSNLLSAIEAGGGKKSAWAEEYLSQLDTRTLADVAGTGKITKQLEALGWTSDEVKTYANKVLTRGDDRNIGLSPGQGGMPDEVQRQMMEVSKAGSFKDYLAGKTKGLEGDDLAKAREQEFTVRGLLHHLRGTADTDEAGIGVARAEAGFGEMAGTRRKGRGAFTAASGTELLENQMNVEEDMRRGQDIQKNAGFVEGKIREAARTGSNAVTNAGGITGDLGQASGAVKDFIAALQAATASLNRGRGTYGQAGAR